MEWVGAEHMLFYSSEKYPVEDSYSTFLAEVRLLTSATRYDDVMHTDMSGYTQHGIYTYIRI